MCPPEPASVLPQGPNDDDDDGLGIRTLTVLPSPSKPPPFSPKPLPTPKSIITLVTNGDLPVFGQCHYSHVDKISQDPLEYFDTKTQIPLEISRLVAPPVDIYLSGDGFLRPLVPNTYSIAGHPAIDGDFFIGRSSLLVLPIFLPFDGGPPSLSHETFVKTFVTKLRASQKKGVLTNMYVAYCTLIGCQTTQVRCP